MSTNLDELQILLGYTFRDYTLLKLAIDHNSKPKDVPNVPMSHPSLKSWKMEYIGDALIKVVIGTAMFRGLELKPESLNVINSNHWIHVCGLEIGIKPVEKGQKVSDKFEAIIGAIYIDCDDLQVVYDIIYRRLHLDRFEQSNTK